MQYAELMFEFYCCVVIFDMADLNQGPVVDEVELVPLGPSVSHTFSIHVG